MMIPSLGINNPLLRPIHIYRRDLFRIEMANRKVSEIR